MATLKYTNKLHNKRILVIGGTSGIGFCVAENCIENGAIVTVASSRQTSIDNAISRLTKSYPQFSKNIHGHTVDLKSDDAESHIVALLNFATNNGKDKLDHIADTAGDSLAIKPLKDFTEAYMQEGQKVRWTSALYLAKHVKEFMNISSASSYTMTGGVNTMQPGQNWFLPAAVGAAKEGLARALAVDLRPIRVNLVAPGAILTELFGRFFDTGTSEGKARLDGMVEGFKNQSLVQEIGQPEDVAEAYVYCMRDKFVDGQSIFSEGGMLLAPGAQR